MSSSKIIVIGKGEFGNSLAQGLESACIASTNATASVEHISATEFFSMGAEEAGKVLADSSFVMYCGRKLSENAAAMAAALESARRFSIAHAEKEGPLLDFIDWSNPDPHCESYDGAVELSEALSNLPAQIVWKATGVSSLDVALHEGQHTATIYSNHPGFGQEKPDLDLPGLTWKVASKSTLQAEVLSRLMIRAEVNRWHDANYLGLGVFLVAFGYAFTRYSEWVNGGYGYTMVPLYILDKGISWTALWMIAVAPFAGNLLALSHAFSSWNKINVTDKLASLLCAMIMVIPFLFFLLPWLTWATLRAAFSSWKTHHKQTTRTKSMLVDMVSLKTETGVVGFAYLVTHAFMGCLVAVPQYKSKWFDDTNKGRFYGNNELSLAAGVIAFTLVVLLTIRSLIGKGSWMKLKPLYVYVSPLAIFLATLHVVLMGYKGWPSLFDYTVKKGQPSITWVSSMFSLGVILAHFFLAAVGTKKRARKATRVMKHSANEEAFANYEEVVGSKMVEKTLREEPQCSL